MKRFTVRRLHGETKEDRRLRQAIQDDVLLDYLSDINSHDLAKWLVSKLNKKERQEMLKEIADEYPSLDHHI